MNKKIEEVEYGWQWHPIHPCEAKDRVLTNYDSVTWKQ